MFCCLVLTDTIQRNTYKNRILELKILSAEDDYSGSARPGSEFLHSAHPSSELWHAGTNGNLEYENRETIQTHPVYDFPDKFSPQSMTSPPYQQSLQTSKHSPHPSHLRHSGSKDQNYHARFNSQGLIATNPAYLRTPIYETFTAQDTVAGVQPHSEFWRQPGSERTQEDDENTSWLKTINESSSSSASSMHSRISPRTPLQRLQRMSSSAIEAEFDAALHAAMDTAYDNGFEPDDDEDEDDDSNVTAPRREILACDPKNESILRGPEVGREEDQHMQRERFIQEARERHRVQSRQDCEVENRESDDETDHERRMLEDMTKEYLSNDAQFDEQSKPALPRQSDSSELSGRTWGSFGSNPTSAGTSLSTVAEIPLLPTFASETTEKMLPPLSYPPPTNALPSLPQSVQAPLGKSLDSPPPTLRDMHTALHATGVRDRRLSGLPSKQLKIETRTAGYGVQPPKPNTSQPDQSLPKTIKAEERCFGAEHGGIDDAQIEADANNSHRKTSSVSEMTKVSSIDTETTVLNNLAHGNRKSSFGLRKALSTSSLRNDGSGPHDLTEMSPNTSISSASSGAKHKRLLSAIVPTMPKPPRTEIMVRDSLRGINFVFNTEFHIPLHSKARDADAGDGPLPLEPCPNSSLLRPFWFLRTVFQTIANPQGAYLTARLFVPRDIWSIKNTKLKSVEEKITVFDLLTVALLRLAKVDTLDADALLEEMQTLENVLEQAQATLIKKLGNEVGVHATINALKGSTTGEDESAQAEPSANVNANNKSYLKSFQRKLRTKHAPNATTALSGVSQLQSKAEPRDSFGLKSLPMTNEMARPRVLSDLGRISGIGPYPGYMDAMARLCDAAQILGK